MTRRFAPRDARPLRRVAGIAIVLLLSACTGSEPGGTIAPSGGGQVAEEPLAIEIKIDCEGPIDEQPDCPPPEPRSLASLGFGPGSSEPSTPLTGEVVMGFSAQNMPGRGYCRWFVYADGQVVSLDHGPPEPLPRGAVSAYLERRLTPRGIELLREAFLSSPRVRPGWGGRSSYNTFVVQLFEGDRVSSVRWNGPGTSSPTFEIPEPDVEDMYMRMSDLRSWLPESAWADARIRAFAPSRYFVYGDPVVHPLALPSPADSLLLSRGCQVITAEEARAIVASLEVAGLAASGDPTPDLSALEYRYERNRGVAYLSIYPALPHQASC